MPPSVQSVSFSCSPRTYNTTFCTICILLLLYQNPQCNFMYSLYPSVALPEPTIKPSVQSVSFCCSTRTHNAFFRTVCILQLLYQNPQYNLLYSLYPSVALPGPTIPSSLFLSLSLSGSQLPSYKWSCKRVMQWGSGVVYHWGSVLVGHWSVGQWNNEVVGH